MIYEWLNMSDVAAAEKGLRVKGMVNATRERPALFSAVSLEKVLELSMKAMMEQTKALQASRKELLSTWCSMNEKDSANS